MRGCGKRGGQAVPSGLGDLHPPCADTLGHLLELERHREGAQEVPKERVQQLPEPPPVAPGHQGRTRWSPTLLLTREGTGIRSWHKDPASRPARSGEVLGLPRLLSPACYASAVAKGQGGSEFPGVRTSFSICLQEVRAPCVSMLCQRRAAGSSRLSRISFFPRSSASWPLPLVSLTRTPFEFA